MDEQIYNELNKLALAIRALSKSVDRALMTNTFEGTAKMMVKNYRSLQARAAQLLPEDYFITDTLVLEVEESSNEREMVAQVQFAVQQLSAYVDGQLRGQRGSFPNTPVSDDFRSLGRDLQDQIINVTKYALRRALTNIDIGINEDVGKDFEADWDEKSKGSKKRIKIQIERRDDTEKASDPENPDVV